MLRLGDSRGRCDHAEVNDGLGPQGALEACILRRKCGVGRTVGLATRDELYAKFGITAEATQLFEAELGTMLLCARGLEHGWHVEADPDSARKLLDDIDRSTLGRLLGSLRNCVSLDDGLTECFASALKARNRLFHGFYESHNFKIQTDEGRDAMIADLEVLHDELFNAWQVASAMTATATKFVLELRGTPVHPVRA